MSTWLVTNDRETKIERGLGGHNSFSIFSRKIFGNRGPFFACVCVNMYDPLAKCHPNCMSA